MDSPIPLKFHKSESSAWWKGLPSKPFSRTIRGSRRHRNQFQISEVDEYLITP